MNENKQQVPLIIGVSLASCTICLLIGLYLGRREGFAKREEQCIPLKVANSSAGMAIVIAGCLDWSISLQDDANMNTACFELCEFHKPWTLLGASIHS